MVRLSRNVYTSVIHFSFIELLAFLLLLAYLDGLILIFRERLEEAAAVQVQAIVRGYVPRLMLLRYLR